MPAFATITVDDRESTPVAHAFTPRSDSNGVAEFRESTGVPIGDSVLTISLRETSGKYRARIKMAMPTVVTETINGVDYPKVARTAYADLTVTFADSSTLQERKNLIGMFANTLAASQTVPNGVLTSLEEVY